MSLTHKKLNDTTSKWLSKDSNPSLSQSKAYIFPMTMLPLLHGNQHIQHSARYLNFG